MTKETLLHCIAVLEYYAETPSGKEPENAEANALALQELDDQYQKILACEK
jgi:hypothetical protein